eukprot:1195431-Prorocentrum_minimum.AAC.10
MGKGAEAAAAAEAERKAARLRKCAEIAGKLPKVAAKMDLKRLLGEGGGKSIVIKLGSRSQFGAF